MRSRLLFVGILLAAMAGLSGCATPSSAPRPPLVLISMDGYRADYVQRFSAESTFLRQLAQTGMSASALIPVFPSNTFPNHYTIVTGLYPARHGIINNHMFDPGFGAFFHYNQPGTATHSRWWSGEPIWVTAIKQGGKAGSWFWVGSEAEIGGVRPDTWRLYDAKLPFEQRLDELVAWLGKNRSATGPVVATFYLEEINSVGHKFGPDSAEIAAAVKVADDRLALLHSRLRTAGIEANLVIVADHGMTPISPERVLLFDDYIDLSSVQIEFDGSVAGLRPLAGNDPARLAQALARVPHAKVYRSADLPARFHLRNNVRIPPVWVVPEEGWEILTRRSFETIRGRMNKGDHGFDPALPSMHAIFVAHGPSIRSGAKTGAVEIIHVYNLLCAALGLKPAPNDGDDRLVKAALK